MTVCKWVLQAAHVSGSAAPIVSDAISSNSVARADADRVASAVAAACSQVFHSLASGVRPLVPSVLSASLKRSDAEDAWLVSL